MTPQETFVTRLRRYRERNQISVEEIATQHNIRRDLLEALENNDLSEWPCGLYARAWIRAYAGTVGLDPAETVDEFCRLFPHGDRRMATTVQGVAAIVAHPSEYREDIAPELDRRRSGAGTDAMPAPAWYVALARSAYQLLSRVAPPLTTRRAGPDSARRATP